MATRYDVSAVPPQGGYVAKQCPVRAQWDAIHPREPLRPSAALERRFARGKEFEADVVADLRRLHADARTLRSENGERRSEREEATLAAMASGAGLIIGGRLPTDRAGHRAGEPDLLVATAGAGYRPVDIKHHRTLVERPAESNADAALCSALDSLTWETAEAAPAMAARKRREDLLQLAHYQRMLEAAGLAGGQVSYGGIIGVERVVTWHDLDAPVWRTPSSSARSRLRTTMQVYDFEFDFRLDIISVATASSADPAITPLVVPVKIGECAQCPWWSCCGPRLEAGSGDVSLLPRVGWREWRIHRDHGVDDRAALAALDYRTATLIAAGLDLRPVLSACGRLPGDTELAAVLGSRKQAQLSRLAEAGLHTLRDAAELCPRTASYSDVAMQDLPEQIDQARAALGGRDAYRRRQVGAVLVPRADVEVDIDMENTADGVYLWGTLVSIRAAWTKRPAGYRAFLSWEPMTAAIEAEIFIEFWGWLNDMRAAAAANGLSLRAYCYNASAENTQLRRLAAACGLAGEVAAFIDSAQWVDLYRVFAGQLITGRSTALKTVAPLAGFAWDVPDPGGEEAMLRYDQAAGPDGDPAARAWLVAYNKNDTEATKALRIWLHEAASGCPSIADAVEGLPPGE
ncbi:MAG: TM0106 family RecB-like putative nuclease [Streptosporangiaceae bacterium]